MSEESGFENGDPTAVEQFNYDEVDKLPAELQELIDRKLGAEEHKIIWEAVTRFAAVIMEHKEPDVTVTAFAFAAGLYITEGLSITELAKRLSKPGRTITKQALSKRVVLVTTALNLPPSRGMKSVEARGKYREAQLKK